MIADMTSLPEHVEIKKSLMSGNGLFAKDDIRKGSILFHFDGRVGDDAHTNSESLQIGEDVFLESTIGFDDFLNHSCYPNCFIDWLTLNLVSLRRIRKGEELTYHYCTSDWNDVHLLQDHSFTCKCSARNCIGKVKGFRYLTPEQKRKLRPLLSPFLMEKLRQRRRPRIRNLTEKEPVTAPFRI